MDPCENPTASVDLYDAEMAKMRDKYLAEYARLTRHHAVNTEIVRKFAAAHNYQCTPCHKLPVLSVLLTVSHILDLFPTLDTMWLRPQSIISHVNNDPDGRRQDGSWVQGKVYTLTVPAEQVAQFDQVSVNILVSAGVFWNSRVGVLYFTELSDGSILKEEMK